jgi:hypothetical protein
MEEEEIELWYEDQKQQLSEQYIKCIDKGMSLEQREKKFSRKMDCLNRKYNKKHTKYLKQKDTSKKRKQFWTGFFNPFRSIRRSLALFFKMIGAGVSGAFRTRCAQIRYQADMAWIKKGYKITDGFARGLRPVYFFYVKHLQRYWLEFIKPFKRFGLFVKNTVISIGQFFSKAAARSWKGMKISAKFIAKHSSAVSKKLSARMEEMSKRYHEAYAKKVQAHLDKKQQKKEEKEKKRKAKEEAKQAFKEGETAEHPGQAPDAETTT